MSITASQLKKIRQEFVPLQGEKNWTRRRSDEILFCNPSLRGGAMAPLRRLRS